MATFIWTPDNGATYETKPNVRTAKYGDGYEQRQANGINNMPKTWSLRFSVRTDSEIAPIASFLEAQAGVSAFTWTDPFGNTGRYVCRSWSREKTRYNINSISATFEQVYEP